MTGIKRMRTIVAVSKSARVVDSDNPAFSWDKMADKKLYNDHGNAVM